jgi:hypothetical protein
MHSFSTLFSEITYFFHLNIFHGWEYDPRIEHLPFMHKAPGLIHSTLNSNNNNNDICILYKRSAY